jgi:membrane fusion protein, multidrug efflux system
MRCHAPLVVRTGLLAAISVVAGCGPRPPAVVATAPTPVTVSLPIERNVTDHVELTGRTSAVQSVEVRARVGGYLDKINFKEGLLVKKGDVLFEIDPRPYQAQVDFAKGQVAAQEATLKKAKADNARNQGLAHKSPGAVTQQDLDQYQAAEDQGIANLQTAKATLATNELNLAFTKVISPIDGRASRFYITLGNLVVQDQTLLTTIVSVDPIYADFDVDERTVLRVRQLIREGKARSARDSEIPVLLELANEQGFPHHGTINFVDNQVNPQTGTLRVRGVFENRDEALSPGLFVRVQAPIGGPHPALLVVERAIDSDQGQKILYIVNKKHEVVYRPIAVGALHDGLRVIESGLQPGEQVIVNGLQRVRPGAVVDPKPVDMPVAPSAARPSASSPEPKPATSPTPTKG